MDNKGRYIHGMYGTRLNHIWANMRTRCNCKTNKDYPLYGGRGIKVCKEWDEFINFYTWAMNNGYSDNLSIDRIDVDGDYCPSNCRWITLYEQQSNKRNNHIIKHNGEEHTIAEWSRITGISYNALISRIASGATEEEIFYAGRKPLRKKGHIVDGKLLSTAEICKRYGINKNTFNTRLGRGWSIDEIVKGKRNV